MYAIVRDTTYDPTRLAQGSEELAEFQALHARQPGYQGSMMVDAGNGRWLTVNLWESEEHATAARSALVPEVRRLLEPVMAAPSQVIGVGPVVASDLTKA